MFVTIPDTVLQSALHATDHGEGLIYGRTLDGGDVVQITGIYQSADPYLGRWIVHNDSTPFDSANQSALSEGDLLLVISEQPQLEASAYTWNGLQLQPIPSNVIRLHADYNARLHGLFEADRLAKMCVTVIGLGTGGAVVATQLARCGVGQMRLIDFDRLEVHNIARHVCTLRDIGRYKTRAMRDLLLDISPMIQVETYEADVLAQPDVLQQVVADCDLVIAATDSEASKLAINHVCWAAGVPAIYGAAYNRAFGGDVFRVIPADGACYDCFHEVVTEYFGPPPAATTDFSLGYSDPSRMADLTAEPGLGLDVGMIALIMTRMALMTLLRQMSTTLPDLPTNWVLFGNRAEWLFQKQLESIFIEVPKRSLCPTCNYESYVQSQLGMSAAEADEQAAQLLTSIPAVDSPLESRKAH